jgi:leucyl-tRNA synthetase
LFVISNSPPDRDLEWTDAGIQGTWKYLCRVWRIVIKLLPKLSKPSVVTSSKLSIEDIELCKTTHRTIQKVTNDIEKFHFNLYVSHLREFTNALTNIKELDVYSPAILRKALETLVTLLNAVTPHLCEELWSLLGHQTLLVNQSWPTPEPTFVAEEIATLAVQLNGKLRGTIDVAIESSQNEIEQQALQLEPLKRSLNNRPVKKVIIVPGKIVNVVA